jgi:hypothetical protein
VSAALDGVGTIEGVVDYVTPEFLGVRTSTGLYRFIHALGGAVFVEHHYFAPGPNEYATADAWRTWLGKEFGSSGIAVGPVKGVVVRVGVGRDHRG